MKESEVAPVFSVPRDLWLRLCPDGSHYRPVENGDLRIGQKILKVEIPLNTSVSGSIGNHPDALMVTRVLEYSQQVICHGPDGEEAYPIARMLAEEIAFFEQPMWGSKWRKSLVGAAFVVER